MRGSAHEARLVFDEFGQLSANRRLVEGICKRLVLFSCPLLRGSGDVRDVNNLQVRGRRGRGVNNGSGFVRESSPNMLEHELNFGGGRDTGGG